MYDHVVTNLDTKVPHNNPLVVIKHAPLLLAVAAIKSLIGRSLQPRKPNRGGNPQIGTNVTVTSSNQVIKWTLGLDCFAKHGLNFDSAKKNAQIVKIKGESFPLA